MGLLIFEDKKEVRLLVHEGLKLMDGCRVEEIEKPSQDETRQDKTRLNCIKLYEVKLNQSESNKREEN